MALLAFAAPSAKASDRGLPGVTTKPSAMVRPVGLVVPYKIEPLQKQNRKSAPDSQTIIKPSPVSNSIFDRGIAAYRKGDMKSALRAFVTTADNKKAGHFERAAGAFWAARVAERLNKYDQANEFFVIAAQYDRSFYGQLARARLGQSADLSWDRPRPTLAAMERLQSEGLGKLAVDHVAAGRLSAADQTLIQLAGGADAELRLAILAFALHHGLPATALKLANVVEGDTGVRYDAAFYPVGGWIEADDFRVDRALVHAIVRQESGFNPQARSNMGAVGLMQLMPSTANYIIKVKAGGAPDRDLTHSVQNLKLGQHYLEYLLASQNVQGDVLKMLVAYNAGPGNLAKWQRDLSDANGDPLLFIETIPSAETRAYVEKVMSAYWIYRDQFGMSNPTRIAVATAHPASVAAPLRTWFAGFKLDRIAMAR